MKFFVTGVGGQLGHDVMNELHSRGYEGVGSDIAPVYSGVADGSAVTTMPYVQLDITDGAAVKAVLTQVKPDVVVHCAAWTAVDMAEDDENVAKAVHVQSADDGKKLFTKHRNIVPFTQGKQRAEKALCLHRIYAILRQITSAR